MSKNFVELLTIADANAVASKLNAAAIGGGVKEIYDIQGNYGMAPPTVDPDDPQEKMYGFRFNNGADGISAGLCKMYFDTMPEAVAIERLKLDVAAQAKPSE